MHVQILVMIAIIAILSSCYLEVFGFIFVENKSGQKCQTKKQQIKNDDGKPAYHDVSPDPG